MEGSYDDFVKACDRKAKIETWLYTIAGIGFVIGAISFLVTMSIYPSGGVPGLLLVEVIVLFVSIITFFCALELASKPLQFTILK